MEIILVSVELIHLSLKPELTTIHLDKASDKITKLLSFEPFSLSAEFFLITFVTLPVGQSIFLPFIQMLDSFRDVIIHNLRYLCGS